MDFSFVRMFGIVLIAHILPIACNLSTTEFIRVRHLAFGPDDGRQLGNVAVEVANMITDGHHRALTGWV